MNYRNTLVVAPVFGYSQQSAPEGVRWMLETAKFNGVEVVLVGLNEPFTNVFDCKITRLWNILKDVTGYEYIMMVDAIDTLFATGVGEIHAKFERYKSDFVISGQPGVWPWPNRYADHPLKHEKFGGLNSGFYLATWDAFRRTMLYLTETQKDDGHCEEGQTLQNQDQAAFWKAYMEGLPMQIDYQCLLSQTTFGLDKRWVLNHDIDWGRRPFNKTTKVCPCTFHCNGLDKWRLGGIFDQLMR